MTENGLCKNCIHNGVCHTQEMNSGETEAELNEFGCDDFKDINSCVFIDLKIGQAVFIVDGLMGEVISSVVDSYLVHSVFGKTHIWYFAKDFPAARFTKENIGKTVFFSEEEAREKLKEFGYDER